MNTRTNISRLALFLLLLALLAAACAPAATLPVDPRVILNTRFSQRLVMQISDPAKMPHQPVIAKRVVMKVTVKEECNPQTGKDAGGNTVSGCTGISADSTPWAGSGNAQTTEGATVLSRFQGDWPYVEVSQNAGLGGVTTLRCPTTEDVDHMMWMWTDNEKWQKDGTMFDRLQMLTKLVQSITISGGKATVVFGWMPSGKPYDPAMNYTSYYLDPSNPADKAELDRIGYKTYPAWTISDRKSVV